MDWFLLIYFIISIIFFMFYFINMNLFNLLPSSIITDFKKIATQNNQLTKPTQYKVTYVNNNYLISDNGVVYIDTSTSLLNINFSFISYVYDITKDYAIIVPIIKSLQPIT